MKLAFWISLVVPLAVIASSCALFWLVELPIWAGFLVGVVGVVVNTLLLRWEDKQSGGLDDF